MRGAEGRFTYLSLQRTTGIQTTAPTVLVCIDTAEFLLSNNHHQTSLKFPWTKRWKATFEKAVFVSYAGGTGGGRFKRGDFNLSQQSTADHSNGTDNYGHQTGRD